ncbi:MAG TPA: diacylglycerol kinase, partial [Hyphomicrobiaceae bacterium]|nr:diacylglycerol kinase [Hyphomicrobiaceae bacterium]
LDGATTRITGGIVNGHPFFLWVGAGFDGRVAGALHHGAKRRLGKLAYGGAIARAIAAPLDPLTVEVDGRCQPCGWVVVTNASRYGGRFHLTDRTELSKPGLVAVLLTDQRRGTLAKVLLALATGRLPDLARSERGVACLPATRVVVTAERPISAQVDGDPERHARLEIRAGGPAFDLIIPPAAST